MSTFSRPETAGLPDVPAGEPAPAGGAARSRRRVRINALGLIGLSIIVAACLFCFVGPLVYHTNQVASVLAAANDPPGGGHPLGTDANGFDVLGRLMIGGQSSLEIGCRRSRAGHHLRSVWGAIAGFYGGIVDADHDAHRRRDPRGACAVPAADPGDQRRAQPA